MFRYSLWIAIGLIIVAAACGSEGARLNKRGNEAFNEQDYEESIQAYKAAQVDTPDLAEPYYNAGSAYYRQEDYEGSRAQIEQSLRTAEGSLREDSYFNLGNTYFRSEQFEGSIEAYKQALRLNPDSQDAKHNLELALERLEDQPQDDQQADAEGGQEAEDGQPEPDQGEDGQDADQPQPARPPDGPQQGQSPEQALQEGPPPEQARPGELTEEQAIQLLEAVAQETETLQEALQQAFIALGPPPERDW